MGWQARSEKEKRNRKNKILKAAAEVFSEKGFYGTHVAKIALRAKVSTGTFYLYFRNKTDIYKEIQNAGLDILTAMARRAISKAGSGTMERITALISAYLQFYQEQPTYFGIIAIWGATPRDLKETESGISAEIYRKTHYLLKLFEDILARGVARGELLPMDTAKVTVIFWGIMDGLVLLEERRNRRNIIGMGMPEMVQQVLRIAFYGLLADRTAPLGEDPGAGSAGA